MPSIDDVIAQYLRDVDLGAAPERERLIADHPELADELKQYFADCDLFDHRFQVEAHNSDGTITGKGELDQESTHAKPLQLTASTVVDKYKLLQPIGEGGMGAVWMAQQVVPVRRKVAIKFVKSVLASPRSLARFDAERQALAMMDHQNIAKVFDGGTTADGNPYLVMELVQGIPIAEFCDQQRLTIAERLELFIPVCHAIQHAHQKGIVHRDLKPSNILVSLYDGRPVPKVIDFGLAKALQQGGRLTDLTLFTEFGQIMGTYRYMSPEQAEVNALDVDTRTDVYSLGILLYELLTGYTPIDQATVKSLPLLEILKTIREKVPPRPSQRLQGAAEKVNEISACRGTEPAKLQRWLQGDLDWIVMKAIEKERSRRYDSPARLADDLVAYIERRPVSARAPSWTYQATRFVQRHRLPVFAVAGIAVTLIAATVISILFAWQAKVAKAQAVQREQDVTDVAEVVRELFSGLDYGEEGPTGRKLQEDLGNRLVETLNAMDKVAPSVQKGEMLLTLARTLSGIGHPKDALRAYGEGRDMVQTLNPARQSDLKLKLEEAVYRNGMDECVKTIAVLESNIDQIVGSQILSPVDKSRFLKLLANAYREEYRAAEAEKLLPDFQKLYSVLEPSTREAQAIEIALLEEQIAVDIHVGRIPEAIQQCQHVIELGEKLYGPNSAFCVRAMTSLADTHRLNHQLELAEQIALKAQARSIAEFGPEHPVTLSVLNQLVRIYGQGYTEETFRSKLADVLPKAEVASNRILQRLVERHRQVYIILCNLGAAQVILGNEQTGFDHYRRALKLSEQNYGRNHGLTQEIVNKFATALKEQFYLADALELYQEHLAYCLASRPADKERIERTREALSQLPTVMSWDRTKTKGSQLLEPAEVK